MLLVGVLAEIVAGSMGMGYGVICTTTLLFLGIPPHAVSASIHSAESFTTAAGSISHIRLKNVSKNLVKRLAIPAIFGAIIGAVSLTYLGEYYSKNNKNNYFFFILCIWEFRFSRMLLNKNRIKKLKK